MQQRIGDNHAQRGNSGRNANRGRGQPEPWQNFWDRAKDQKRVVRLNDEIQRFSQGGPNEHQVRSLVENLCASPEEMVNDKNAVFVTIAFIACIVGGGAYRWSLLAPLFGAWENFTSQSFNGGLDDLSLGKGQGTQRVQFVKTYANRFNHWIMMMQMPRPMRVLKMLMLVPCPARRELIEAIKYAINNRVFTPSSLASFLTDLNEKPLWSRDNRPHQFRPNEYYFLEFIRDPTHSRECIGEKGWGVFCNLGFWPRLPSLFDRAHDQELNELHEYLTPFWDKVQNAAKAQNAVAQAQNAENH